MFYEVPDAYAPPHQLVFMFDANKDLAKILEQYFPDALHSRCLVHLIKNLKDKRKKKKSWFKFENFFNKNIRVGDLQVQCS